MKQRPKGPRSLLWAVAALAAALALAPDLCPADPLERSAPRVLSEGPGYFEAVLDVPTPIIAPARLGGKEAARLKLPGWISSAPEGAPFLPMRSLAAAVPEGETVQVTVTGEDPLVYSGLSLIPYWSGLREEAEPIAVPSEAAAGEIYGRNAFWPSELYETRKPTYLRDLRLLPIDVRPARYNPRTGELIVYRRLRVRVESERSEGTTFTVGPAPARRDAGGWERIYRAAAMNYPSQMASRALRRRPLARAAEPRDYFSDGDRWIAMEVVDRGMYSISYEDLLASHVPVSDLEAIDPSTLRVFNGGGLPLDIEQSVEEAPDWMTECAILVEDGGDGSFDAGDRVIFFGQGAEGWRDHLEGLRDWRGYAQNLHTDKNVYWLTWGGSFESGAPRRMQVVDGAPGREGAYRPTSYMARVHVEQNLEWDPSLRYPGIRWERWWWQLLSMKDAGGRAYRTTLRDVETDAPCRLRARFWGSDFVWGCLEHHILDISFNGGPKFRRGGHGRNRIEVDTTAVWAVEGENLLVAEIPFMVDPCLEKKHSKRVDESYFAWFELEYYRRFRARGGELAFDWLKHIKPPKPPEPHEPAFDRLDQTSGPVRFETYGFDDGPVLIFDVTSRYRPSVISGATVSADTVTFERYLNGPRSNFIMVSEGALRTPVNVKVRAPGALRGRGEPVDYIIVSGGELIDAAQILSEWRRGHLLGITDGGGAAAVEVVDVSDIYDEFSWGMVDPVAIRNFLEYRFKSAPEGERPPSYALMFGDATWDFRDFYHLGVKSVVPSYDEAYDRLTQTQYSSDDFLVLFEGPEDRFSDMAIGRLSPATSAEAMGLVTNKVIGFEGNADPGPWRCNVILAADDACIEREPESSGEQHTEQVDDLSKRHIPRALDRTKVYLYEYGGPGCSAVSKPEARKDLIEALNKGAILMNYVGHGSAQVLAQERLLLADDVATLENGGRLGLFVTASCAVGKFDEPLDIGMAEQMVRTDSRGALAAYGATTLAFIPPNKELNAWLAEALLPRPVREDSVNVGPATTLGLSVVEAEATFGNWYYETPYKYVLLGDPASVLAVPGTAYPLPEQWLRVDLDLNKSTLGGGERDTLRGRIMDGDNLASWFDGEADVLVEGAEAVRPLGLPDYPKSPDDRFEDYVMPGPAFYRGRTDVAGGEFEISWTNPYELIAGEGGRVRAYAWNANRDALGALARLRITAPAGPRSDGAGPVVELSFEGGGDIVTPGATLNVRVSDPSGVNLAPVLAENSLSLWLYNDDLDELVDGPVDLAGDFVYEKGSSSEGSARYRLPGGLPTDEGSNSYRVDVSASDNFSNRTTGRLAFDVVSAEKLELTDVVNYPNPFSASTTIGFRVMKEADVVVKIYTVSGRHVRTLRSPAVRGWGHVVWDGTDSAGDQAANGVYLYKVTASGTGDGGEKADFVGKAVLLR